MGPNGAHSELIYHDGTVYEGWIGSRFIIVHKVILVISQGYIGDNEQSIWFELIDYLEDPMWLINQLRPIFG